MEDKSEQTEVTRYKFTVDQYRKMAEVGILPFGQGEELLDGVVWDRSPLVRNRCHPALKGGVTRFLNEAEGLAEEFDAQIHKYTAEEYQVMGESGILTRDDRVELIDGEIVLMPPIGSSHQETVDAFNELFVTRFSALARVRVQGPVRVSERAEPEPDVMLLRRRPEPYRSAHPGPSDALLVVEVSDTTLRYDRNTKVPYYAHHGIAEVWLVNLREDVIEVYREPSGGAYLQVTQARRGETLAPLAFPDSALEVEELLG